MNNLTKKIVNAASEELEKVKKSASTQIVGDKPSQPIQPEPINWHGDAPEVTPEEERKIKMRGLQNVQALESQINQIVNEKKQTDQQRWNQPLILQKEQERTGSVVAMPTSKPGRNMRVGKKPKSQMVQAELPKKVSG